MPAFLWKSPAFFFCINKFVKVARKLAKVASKSQRLPENLADYASKSKGTDAIASVPHFIYAFLLIL